RVVASKYAPEPFGSIPLQVDATAKSQGDPPGGVGRFARIYRLVKIPVGRPCGLGADAVIAIPEEEGSKAIARCTVRPGGADRGVCRRHAGIKIEQACRIVTLIVIVTEHAEFCADFEGVFPDSPVEHRVE